MRNPTMHIKLSDFTDILSRFNLQEPEKLAKSIFSQAVPFNVRSRYIVSGNAKTRAKAERAIKAAKAADMTVQRFNLLLTTERKKAGHKFITPIRSGTPEFIQLNEIANRACEFSNNCDIASIDEGCTIFISLGLDFMKKSSQYSLGKFKYYEQQIYKLYESCDMINSDPKPKRTRMYHDCYASLLAEYAGITRELTVPQDYVNFIFARLDAEHIEAHPEDWLRSQFEQLGKMFNAVPNPNQLFGDNATKRYYDYFSTPIKDQQETKVLMDLEKPKNDFEARYQEKLRSKYSE